MSPFELDARRLYRRGNQDGKYRRPRGASCTRSARPSVFRNSASSRFTRALGCAYHVPSPESTNRRTPWLGGYTVPVTTYFQVTAAPSAGFAIQIRTSL